MLGIVKARYAMQCMDCRSVITDFYGSLHPISDIKKKKKIFLPDSKTPDTGYRIATG